MSKLLALPMGAALLIMAACSGSAVVTLTATPSSDRFIAYRVSLNSIRLQTSGGRAGVTILPTATSVDFTQLFDLSEVLAAPGVAKGTYTGAFVTLDFSTAQIIYDDGSLDGVALTPVDAQGKALGLVSVAVAFDPGNPFRSAAKQVARVSLDFNLASSSLVNLGAKTVTITPMISASTLPIDAKQVRVRGPLQNSNAAFFATGITPFDSATAGPGQLSIEPSSTTNYDINGFVSVGTAGQAQLAALPANSLVQTFGTLTITTPSTAATTPAGAPAPVSTTPIYGGSTSSTASTVSFIAAQVLVDSVQGLAVDRVTGVVSARNGNILGLEDATLDENNGTVIVIPGTTIVNVGPGTLVSFFGQNAAGFISPQEISVGSVIEAFGTATQTGTSGVVLDASAGRVRLDLSTAEGLVTAQGTAALTLSLTRLGGRSISAFDFVGSAATGNQYGVATGGLALTSAVVGAPVVVTGFPNTFGTAPPNFNASALADPTTIQSELVIDWGAGTAAPFTSFDDTAVVLNAANSALGVRHQIAIGPQIVDLAGLSPGPTITPNTSGPAVYSIGHSTSFTIESFDTYAAFVTQLQSELNGATLATGMTAVGQYTVSSSAFSATGITVFLNN